MVLFTEDRVLISLCECAVPTPKTLANICSNAIPVLTAIARIVAFCVAVDGEEGITASFTDIDEVVSRCRVEIHDWGLEDLGWGHWHVELLEVATTIGCHMMRFSFSDEISLRRERREEDETQIFRG